MIASDFTIGQRAFVIADQAIREGIVTKLGRTRVTIRHPRNTKDGFSERPYQVRWIVLGIYDGEDYLYGTAVVHRYLMADGRTIDSQHKVPAGLPLIVRPRSDHNGGHPV